MLFRLLGAGGFGQVYRAVRGGVQDVAIKTLSYSDDLQLQQFLVEIKLLKSLSFDRNVVQFYGRCADAQYCVCGLHSIVSQSP